MWACVLLTNGAAPLTTPARCAGFRSWAVTGPLAATCRPSTRAKQRGNPSWGPVQASEVRPQARGQAAANGLLDSTSPTPYGSRTAGTSYRRWQVSRPRCAPNRCAISGSQMALRGGKPTPDLACSRETSPPRKNQPGAADETPASGVGGAERPGPGHQTAFDPHHTDLFNQNANHLVSDKLWAPFKPAGQPLYRMG